LPPTCKIQKADIVLVSQNLFSSNIYQEILGMKKIDRKQLNELNMTRAEADDRMYLAAVSKLSKSSLFPCKASKKRKDRHRSNLPCAPLEVYYWRRLVIDEIHELVPAEEETGGRIWSLPLKCLSSFSRWGLTGTPNVLELSSINNLGLLMGVNLGTADISPAKYFIESFLSSTQRTERGYPAPIERYVYLQLTVEEMALYQQQRYENLEAIRQQDSKAYENILQCCSHYGMRLRGVNNKIQADDEIDRQLKTKRAKLEALVERFQNAEKVYDRMLSQERAWNEDQTLREDLRREKYNEAVGRKEEARDKMRELRLKIEALERSLDFFNSTLQKLREGSKLPECPICLQQMAFGDATITGCGHLQCTLCIRQLIASQQRCATCREPLKEGEWKIVEMHHIDEIRAQTTSEVAASLKEPGKVPLVTMPEKEYFQHGSKIAFIVRQVELILAQDATAKILVYCQWDSLKRKLVEAFTEYKLNFITLEGKPELLKVQIEKFQSVPICSDSYGFMQHFPNIMLCSLELKAAGLNLQAANHVLFVHPFFSKNPHQAAAWEAQAIGRVLRPGQVNEVNIWRFVALDTVEQELLVKRNIAQWKTHFSSLQDNA